MFLVLQHPFADLRSFVGVPTGRLSRPGWPLPDAGDDFIRSSGAVLSRRAGGLKEWRGEELYGDGRNAFRFPNQMRDVNLGTAEFPAHAQRIHRRFNSDGTVARLEVAASLETSPAQSASSPAQGVAILQRYLGTSIKIRIGTVAPVTASLLEAGASLAAHYLHATTSRKVDAVKPEAWWFKCGVPTLLIDCPESDSFMVLPHSSHVLDSTEAYATVWHAWLQLGKQRVSVWMLRRREGKNADALRRLRIHLLRFHAERECLRLVLQAALGKLDLSKPTPASEALQQYLSDATRLLEKPERHGIDQSALFEAAQTALATQFEGETATLTQIRRQVAVKVDAYLKRSQTASTVVNYVYGDQMNTNIQLGTVTVSGDFNLVTAKNIRNSFNKAAGADISDELKEKLKALTIEVTNLAKQLPPETAEAVTKDLEVLTNEATSQQPRKAWYELSASGLIEAAKTVAEMAAPVSTAVAAVLALLA